MRLSIATKIFVAFAFLVATFTAVLAYGVVRTQSLFDQIERLNRRIVPVSMSLSDAQTDLTSFNLLLNERDPLVIRRTLQVARLVDSLPGRIRQRLKRADRILSNIDLDEYDEPRARRLRRTQNQLDTLREEAVAFTKRAETFTELVLEDQGTDADRQTRQRIGTLQSKLRDSARRLDDRISRLRDDLRDVTERALDRANENERSSLYALGGLSAGALLLALGVLFAILRVVRPLSTLTEAAKRVGEGDYRPIDETPETWFGRDEITLLAEEFNAMAEKLARRDRKLREQHRALLKSERLATVGRMTSAITHELRNPLSSINLNAEMLEESLVERGIDPDDPDIMPLLETIDEEVGRLREITEEYLVYARLPSSELAPEDLRDIVRDLVDFHGADWERQDVSIRVDLPDDPVEVQADARKLRQGLLNIVKNAVEASPDAGRVRVSVDRDDSKAGIAVSDEGPGIDPDVRDELFEPFVTSKSDGTGLGLAMTQQIVEEHRGEIRVDSSEKGTRFIVELPVGEALENASLVDDSDDDSSDVDPLLEGPRPADDSDLDATSDV